MHGYGHARTDRTDCFRRQAGIDRIESSHGDQQDIRIAQESKLLIVEENMARAMSLRWSEYDRARAVS